MAVIRSKREFFELWEAGVLGNRTNLWHDPEAAFASGAREIGFRSVPNPAKRGQGGGPWEKVPRAQVFECHARWMREGWDCIMDDGCPDDQRSIQGELCRTERGIQGYIDTVAQLPMRPAFAAGHARHFGYCETRVLLHRYLDPASCEDIDMLFELYPDAAIEFSSFKVHVGVFPRRNTLIWEVRNY